MGRKRGMERRGVRLISYPLMIKTLSQSCRQPDLGCSFSTFAFFLREGGEGKGECLLVLVVVENTKRANLRGFGTNTSGLLYLLHSLNG
jgi:hypothetical protein